MPDQDSLESPNFTTDELTEAKAANAELVTLLGKVTAHRDSLLEYMERMPYPSDWDDLVRECEALRSAARRLVTAWPNDDAEFDAALNDLAELASNAGT